MKKHYLISSILFILIIFSMSYNIYSKKNINNKNINLEKIQENVNDTEKSVKIYVYNANTLEIEEKEIMVNNINLIDYEDYVKLVLENSLFINDNMSLLAIYKLESNDIIIKLSQEFKDLSTKSLKGLQNSITKTLKLAFPDLGNIIIQVDTNI